MEQQEQEQQPDNGGKRKRRQPRSLERRKKPRKGSKAATSTTPSTTPTSSVLVTTRVPCPGIDRVHAAASKPLRANQQVATLPDSEYHDAVSDDDDDNDKDDKVAGGRKMTTYSAAHLVARRQGMYYFYAHFDSPPESEWGGRNGLVCKIRDALRFPLTSSIRQIWKTLKVIRMYKAQGKEYKGEKEPRKAWVNLLIPIKLYESQLIAELISGDFGFPMTTHFVNQYRQEHGKIHVGHSTIYEACKQMKPSVTKILKRQQGSLDLESDWCIVSHCWATQRLIMFGYLKPEELPAKFLDEDGKVPKCFDAAHVRRIIPECINWWDETHKNQRIGKARNGTKLEWRFKLDGSASLEIVNGTLLPRSMELKMNIHEGGKVCHWNLHAAGS